MVATIACEYCGAPLRAIDPMALRLKYHPHCKRTVDRLAARGRRSDARLLASDPRGHVCDQCGQAFQAKRRDARYCSPRCRTAAHRAG